ncbi:peptidoglycan-binding protein [Streptomyces purpureus]|uniref:peptidoglycan-binding protein n=1 Tax=Streptomyces purpureus TaxID=1951 RepID=UPI001FD4CD72|nr:peptidoglycan-binding protein [Streptomyces purpureus]
MLLSAVGLAAGQMIKSPAQALADSKAPPPSVLSAPVERRVLRDSVILRGTVAAEQSMDVTPAGGVGEGAAVVTKVPVSTGQSLKHGQVILEVSGRPVVALQGALPVYRDLKPGADGADVAQLQKALADLGHGMGGDRRGNFGTGTKKALSAFYRSAGYEPVPAQTDARAQLTAATEAVSSAERAAEDAHEAVARGASSGRAEDTAKDTTKDPAKDRGKGGGESAASGFQQSDLRKQAARADQDLRKARAHLAAVQAENGPMLPASEVVFLSRFPARVDGVSAKVGGQLAGKPALTVSAGALVVKGRLQPHQRGLVRPGQKVEILSEITGTTASATVGSVAATASAAESGSMEPGDRAASAGPPGFLVLIKPDKPLDPSLAGQGVRLTVEAASTGVETVSVPVSAVFAGADGRTSVMVLGAGGAQTRIEVTTGATGDGYVEIRPRTAGQVTEGTRVITGVRTDASLAGQSGTGESAP